MAELIPKEALEAAMTAQLAAMQEKSLPTLLVELQLLPQIIRNIASQLIVNQVAFAQQEMDMVNKQISQGLPIPPEAILADPIDTINQALENLKPIMTGRYREMQLRKLILDTYQDMIDPYFLERTY